MRALPVPRAVALVATLAAGCAAPQRPAPPPVAERELRFSLADDEDPAHALAVVTRRLAARGIAHAEVTAATGTLVARVRAADVAVARALITSTGWFRARRVDERVDLSELLPSPLPEGVRVEPESVPLAAGLVLRTNGLVATAEARGALTALAAPIRLAGRALLLVPSGAAWRLAAVEERGALHGGHVTRCASSGPDALTVTLDASSLGDQRARRVVFELDGVPRAMGPMGADPVLRFEHATDAQNALARCADGLLRGPIRADDQSPSQGTGSSVAP